jgi:uncharacterized protein YjaZ
MLFKSVNGKSQVMVLAVSGLIFSIIGCKTNPAVATNPRVAGSSQVAAAATSSTDISVPERVMALDHGCKLAMDAKLDPNDAVTRETEQDVRRVVSRIQALMSATNLTIHIKLSDKSSEGYIVPTMGVGGHPEGTEDVWIIMQPENPNFKPAFVAWGLPHEMHHAIRMRQPNWHWSLLECMVMEGLADHFVVEVAGGEPGPWARALTQEQIQECLIRAKPDLLVKTESYAEFVQKYQTPWWFGRSGSDPIPRYAGYALGWRMVENYLRAHPEARASSLVQESAEVIAGATPELQ